MKTWQLLILLLLSKMTLAQNNAIDTSNYYNNLKNKGTTDWLRISDAVPVIIDELEKNGYSHAFIDVGKLIKTGKEQYFVVSVAYDNDIKFGFIYQQGHGFPITKRDRYFLTQPGTSYVQSESVNDTAWNDIRVGKLPGNIFLLDEHCYWYQYGGGDTYPVSKEVSMNILRQDIRAYLKRLKRN